MERNKRELDRSGLPDPEHVTRAVEAIRRAVPGEPYATKLGMRALDVRPGYARVEMEVSADMANLFGMTHGGAVFSLLDEGFQLACNSYGVSAFALNLSITYVSASLPGDRLVAEVSEISRTRRTATYECRVSRRGGDLVAHAQALAYRKGGDPPFLTPETS